MPSPGTLVLSMILPCVGSRMVLMSSSARSITAFHVLETINAGLDKSLGLTHEQYGAKSRGTHDCGDETLLHACVKRSIGTILPIYAL